MNKVWDSLRQALQQVETQARTIKIFFRNDDIDDDEISLRQFLEIFIYHEIPVNLAVIPAGLTKEGATLLRSYKYKFPEIIEFSQHGWSHTNHEATGKKCEFGPSRKFELQYSDIANGKKIMQENFGQDMEPIFVPPWNRCNQDTYRALDDLSFSCLSKLQAGEISENYNFQEVSVTLDFFRWKNGAMLKPAEEIISELISQICELEIIGVMLHHKVMEPPALHFLEDLIRELKKSSAVKIYSIQQLLK